MRCEHILSLDDIWTYLYSNNNKIQAFAVLNEGQIIWQTDNWNLVSDVKSLLESLSKEKGSIELSKVSYKILQVEKDFLISTSSDGKGHLLMAHTKSDAWLIAWATPDAVPELAIIDLRYAASRIS